jgi:demethylmenaquinone methyltransferase / 2-methoxy-6-polyprenyl-1,4-benzoquinol methylase
MSRSAGDASDHDRRIAAMFDTVAPRYDFLNRVLSVGRDRSWRARAVALASLGPDEVGLDLGIGTGDLAVALLAASDPSARIVGVDLSEEMLARVRARANALGLATRLEARRADAQALPFTDGSFDRVTAGFTVRNFGDLDAGLREMRRVLRPGGRAVILEFSMPPHPLVRLGYRAYIHGIVPVVATLLGGDADAYRYLPRSVERFPRAEELARRLERAGFTRVRFKRLNLGGTAIHVAET